MRWRGPSGRGGGRRRLAASLLLMGSLACGAGGGEPGAAGGGPARERAALPEAAPGTEVAIFAGGCFWCMEPVFDPVDGVLSTTSGYTGGELPDPTYEQVVGGDTGHVEAVWVIFDPQRVDYATLVELYWRNVDPHEADGQFCDLGSSYRAEIHVRDGDQRDIAEASRDRLLAEGRLQPPLTVRIRDAGPFYPAEEYHQDFYLKQPARYHRYRTACGRDRRLTEVWGDEAGGAEWSRRSDLNR